MEHTEKELSEDPDDSDLASELEKYWQQHVSCVSSMLPERQLGGVVGCWRKGSAKAEGRGA